MIKITHVDLKSSTGNEQSQQNMFSGDVHSGLTTSLYLQSGTFQSQSKSLQVYTTQTTTSTSTVGKKNMLEWSTHKLKKLIFAHVQTNSLVSLVTHTHEHTTSLSHPEVKLYVQNGVVALGGPHMLTLQTWTVQLANRDHLKSMSVQICVPSTFSHHSVASCSLRRVQARSLTSCITRSAAQTRYLSKTQYRAYRYSATLERICHHGCVCVCFVLFS